MASLFVRNTSVSGRLGAAALLAVAGLFATTAGTVAGPPIACAAPDSRGYDPDAIHACWEIVDDQKDRGEITEEEAEQAAFDCCYDNGGEWNFANNSCGPPAQDSPAQLPQFPGEVTETLTPVPTTGPVAPAPGDPTLGPSAPSNTILTPIPGLPPAQTG